MGLIFVLLVSFLPSIQDTIHPQKWLVAGPFSIGAREGIAGVLDSIEGFVPREGDELPSFLAQGGKVKWTSVGLDSNGRVYYDNEDVWWDTLIDIYGYAATSVISYAFTTFNVSSQDSCRAVAVTNGLSDLRALAITKSLSGFRINERGYSANACKSPHPSGDYVTPVLLKPGKNKILISTRRGFSFKLVPGTEPVTFLDDVISPDIIDTSTNLSAPFSVSLINNTTERIISMNFHMDGRGYFKDIDSTLKNSHPLIPKKFGFQLEQMAKVPDSLNELWFPISVSGSEIELKDSIRIGIVKPGAPYKATFISCIDNSVQYFGVNPPKVDSGKNFDYNKKYSLILSLHGASVEANGQVGCYASKDWAYVIAPTNRRPYGFNWEDWGRLDMLEVLNEAFKRFNIDSNRVYLTGHSMGGHGTWINGLTHIGLFAALAPSAGWSNLQMYVPWTLEKSGWFAAPGALAYRNKVLREGSPFFLLDNAFNAPVYVLHGGVDDNVPTVHGRLLSGLLQSMKYDITYNEIPGKNHWWDDDKQEPGVECVDHKDLTTFLKSKVRNPYPKEVLFKLINPSNNNKCYWVTIDEQELLYQDSKIDARASSGKIDILTENIKGFTLTLSPELISLGEIKFIIDGNFTRFNFEKSGQVSFIKKGNKFVLGKVEHKGLCKTMGLYGPMKQGYFTPFVLVYGKGKINYGEACAEAGYWCSNANGFVEVLADTEVTEDIIKNYNLILFGGPDENCITERINSKLPINIKNGSIWLGKERLYGEGLALELIYPNPLNREKFIVLYAGADDEGKKISYHFNVVRPSTGVPDFIIYDRGVKKRGWGGVAATGFFDANWQLNKDLLYKK